MLGEMSKAKGEIGIGGRIAYVAQQAWIVNATVKENVVFHKGMDADKWNECIEVRRVRAALMVAVALTGGRGQKRVLWVVEEPALGRVGADAVTAINHSKSGWWPGKHCSLLSN